MARTLKRKKSSNKIDTNKIIRLTRELAQIKENAKLLSKRESQLKEELGKYVEEVGVKDSKGSKALVIDVDGVKKLIKREKRESISLNQQKAREVLEELGMFEELSDEITERVVNEGYVEQALLNDEISEDDVDRMIDSKVSYAFILKDYIEDEQ